MVVQGSPKPLAGVRFPPRLLKKTSLKIAVFFYRGEWKLELFMLYCLHMKHNIHILDASSSLSRNKDLIIKSIDQTFYQVEKFVPLIPVDIVVKNEPNQVVPETGTGGYSPDAWTIYLSVDVSKKDSDLKTEISKTIVHEYHHCLRWANLQYGSMLGEALVSEGLADHFQLEVIGGNLQPWCTILEKDKMDYIERKAQSIYWEPQYDHNSWFFGNPEKQIPRWAGYALGFSLVKKYLDKTGEKASKLYAKSAREIIDLT